MLDFENPTQVEVLDVKQLHSVDESCPATVIMLVADEFGKKHKIYLRNGVNQSLLETNGKIIVQEQKLPHNNMAREYQIWRNIYAYRAMAKTNIK
jgi:hypothetical protein